MAVLGTRMLLRREGSLGGRGESRCVPVKNTFIHFDADSDEDDTDSDTQSPGRQVLVVRSLSDTFDGRVERLSQDLVFLSVDCTPVSTPVATAKLFLDNSPSTHIPGSISDVEHAESPSTRRDSAALSIGSAMHGNGTCKPCAWIWKAGGCLNSKDCGYCHLCDEGELKRRKKDRIQRMKRSV